MGRLQFGRSPHSPFPWQQQTSFSAYRYLQVTGFLARRTRWVRVPLGFPCTVGCAPRPLSPAPPPAPQSSGKGMRRARNPQSGSGAWGGGGELGVSRCSRCGAGGRLGWPPAGWGRPKDAAGGARGQHRGFPRGCPAPLLVPLRHLRVPPAAEREGWKAQPRHLRLFQPLPPGGRGGPKVPALAPPVPSFPWPGAQRRAKRPCAGQGWGRAGTPAGSEGRGASLCGAPSLGMIVLLPTHCLGGKVDELKSKGQLIARGSRREVSA